MNLIKAYTDYFENVAESYLPISHTKEKPQFATMGREEIIQGTRKNLNLSNWTLVLLKFEPKLSKNESRHFSMQIVGAFEIVKDIAGKEIDKVIFQSEALEYCIEIASKMLNQHVERTFPLGNINDEGIDFYEINEVFDSCVGYGCEFKYSIGFDRKATIKTENWKA